MSRRLSSVLLFSLAAVASYAQAQEVYVPGDADTVPGVTPVLIGVGADGLSTYDVGGVQLAENAQTAILTQYGPAGATVYNCDLSVPGQAACDVQQLYDGVTYAYTEPVTLVGGPAPTVASSSTVDPAAPVATTTTAAVVSTSSSAATAATASSSSSAAATVASASATPRNGGPQPDESQPTSSNVFGANNGAASSSAVIGSLVIAAPLFVAGALAALL